MKCVHDDAFVETALVGADDGMMQPCKDLDPILVARPGLLKRCG